MTTEHDPRTRIVLSWLHEDAHEDAERFLLRALDEVDTTPQRQPRWPARRFATMNTFAKLAIAAAAVLVVAVASFQLLPRASTPGAQPTATLPPTTSPSPPFGMTLTADDSGQADLEGGNYRVAWVAPYCNIFVIEWRGASGFEKRIPTKLPGGETVVELPAGPGKLHRLASCTRDYVVRFEKSE